MEWRVILKNAAEAARKEVLRIYGSSEAVEASGVGYGGDPIRKIDLAAENAIIRVLDGYGVACTLISEESGIKTIGGGSDLYLVVDAVDGTENALWTSIITWLSPLKGVKARPSTGRLTLIPHQPQILRRH